MFEAFEMIMARLMASDDAYIDYTRNTDRGAEFHITLNDFEGFDEDWNEVEREYADPEMVDALEELLEQADEVEGDYYRAYRFEGFSVVVGYASYDI